MYFKILFILFASAFVYPTQASTIQARPFGVVIHRSLIENLIQFLSAESYPLEFDECLHHQRIKGTINFSATKPIWRGAPTQSSKPIYIETIVNDFNFRGFIAQECQSLPQPTDYYRVHLKDQKMGLWINGSTMDISFHRPHLNFNPDNLKIFIGAQEQPLQLLANTEKQAIIHIIAAVAEKKMSELFKKQLRGLNFAEPLENIMGPGSLWSEGVKIQKGSIRLENEGASKEQKRVSFLLFNEPDDPHQNNQALVYSNENFLEMYFHSAFLDSSDVVKLSKLPEEEDFGHHLQSLETRLKFQEIRSSIPFERPPLPKINNDLSLVISNELMNDALKAIYLEGMLRFSTYINLGEQTKDLLYHQAPPVETRIRINPESAPQMKFNVDTMQISVTDYSLDLGTWMEDRLIPSEQINASVSLFSSLHVDTDNETINLKIDSKTFRITLESLFHRMGESELHIVETLTNQVWDHFFEAYPELVLFPTLIRTKHMPFKIVSIEVSPKYTLIGMNVDYEGYQK